MMPLAILLLALAGRSSGTHQPGWSFPSNFLTNYDGRIAKLGDCCCYERWRWFVEPILTAVKYYNAVKTNLTFEYNRRNVTMYPAPTERHFVTLVATEVNNARRRRRELLEQALDGNSDLIPIPPDCCVGERDEDTTTAGSLVQLLCEGGDFMECKRRGSETAEGTCECFHLPEGEPLYHMIKEDGHCVADSNATCNGEDPLTPVDCRRKLLCVNFTTKACKFAYGKDFHCDGIPVVGEDGQERFVLAKQNLFCSPRLNMPESLKDLGGMAGVERGRASASSLGLCRTVLWVILGHFGHTFLNFSLLFK